MAEFHVTQSHGIFDFDWPDEQLKFKVSRIRERSDGTISAELLITTIRKGIGPGLYQYRINLTSAQTIERQAKQLTTKYPEWKEKWSYFLEQVVHDTLERIRGGEDLEIVPVLYEDIPPVHYLVYPLVLEGLPNIIFGDGGSGKSRLALTLYTIISLPWTDNPLGLESPQLPYPFLYLDWEADKNSVARELRSLVTGMKLDNVDLLYRRCVSPLCEDTEAILKLCEKVNAAGVIIDSLGPAAGKGKLREEDSATNFFAALRELNLTSIIVAHNAKDQDRNVRSIFGSVFFTNLARSIWEVRAEQDYDSDTLEMGLIHTKSNYTRRHPPLALRYTFNGVNTYVDQADPHDISALKTRLSAKSQIIDALRSGPLDRESLRQQVSSVTPENFRQALKRLKRDKVVTELGDLIVLLSRENE